MPFTLSPHEVFNPPVESARLWRYMDIPKYLQMLSTRTIWFSRADQLGDSFEGSTTRTTQQALVALDNVFSKGFSRPFNNIRSALPQRTKYFTYINSWHCSEIESAAMWSLYRKDIGISIVTTVERMKDSFTCEDEIFASHVNYINYETDLIPIGNHFWPFVHKRRSFEHEKEVRLITLSVDAVRALEIEPRPKTLAELSERTPFGLSVATDLEKLIAEVRVDPNAPQWFASAIIDVTKQMGFSFEVSQSVLGQDPIF